MKDLNRLSQIEQNTFASETRNDQQFKTLKKQFFYSFADQKFSLNMSAEVIKPTIYAYNKLQLSLKEREIVLRALIQLDIRDAGIRQVDIFISKDMNLSHISSKSLNDYDILKGNKYDRLRLYFSSAQTGKIPVQFNLEKDQNNWNEATAQPWVSVDKAATERGVIGIAVEDGFNLEMKTEMGLRSVPIANSSVMSENVVQAWRFKNSKWAAKIKLSKKPTTINAEVFHLNTVGDDRIYASTMISLHISGAPTQELKLKIPETMKNVTFSGMYFPKVTQNKEIWTVKLKSKVSGSYSLLINYDFLVKDKKSIQLGQVETLGTEN